MHWPRDLLVGSFLLLTSNSLDLHFLMYNKSNQVSLFYLARVGAVGAAASEEKTENLKRRVARKSHDFEITCKSPHA